MSGERHDADLSDDPSLAGFDDELKAALSVVPSADFEVRVLRQIAARSNARSLGWIVYAPLAAAATVAIVAGLVVQRPHQTRDIPSIAPSQTASDRWAPPGPDPRVAVSPVLPASPPAAARLADRSRRGVPRAVRQAFPPAASGRFEPEVIVEPGQAEAIRRLVRAIAEGTIEPPPNPQRGAGAPAPVPVQPLTIEPILVSAAEDRGGPTPVVRPH